MGGGGVHSGVVISQLLHADHAGATYHKKAIYKFVKKVAKKPAAEKKQIFVEKKVGGAKNGGTRMVRVKKLANDYPTVDAAPKGTSVNFFSKHKRTVRASLSAGTVAILLAGVHKGKRVVVLKQLETGLLLVTGPFKLNGTPLRRVNQRFLLATATKSHKEGQALRQYLKATFALSKGQYPHKMSF